MTSAMNSCSFFVTPDGGGTAKTTPAISSPVVGLKVGSTARIGSIARIDAAVPIGTTISYCVAVVARGVEFSARFVPDNKSTAAGVVVLRESGKVKAEEGPTKGSVRNQNFNAYIMRIFLRKKKSLGHQ